MLHAWGTNNIRWWHMTREELDALGVTAWCQRPDPLTCYQHPDEEPCLSCPVASWLTAMIFSGTWTDEGVCLEELALSAR